MSDEKKLMEAALFLTSRPMGLDEFKTLTGIGAVGYLKEKIDELKKDYEQKQSAIEIIEFDGKYSMRVRNEHIEKVKQFTKETEISKSALRTLAFLSKNDNMLKSDLVKKIGTQVYMSVKELTENGFIKQKKFGRTSRITLTEKFKTYFGNQ
ncbi:MAG TPA: SMC-Scp complex subunit ScpB [Candidatus Bilamarchaeaceae archaeon]|nr:SMC-Scp complex subunit ScpB [Candidatus Bilamarchaeaceae archaeon]